MTAWSGLPQLAAGVFTRLRGDAALGALVTGGIYDDVPELVGYPFIAFDDPYESPDRFFGQDGHSSSFTLTIYTQDGSPTRSGKGYAGFKIAMQIVERVLALLIDDTNYIVVSGHDVRNIEIDDIDYSREPDGITRRVDMNFTASLEVNPLVP